MKLKDTFKYLATLTLASVLFISCGDDNSSGAEQSEAPSVETPAQSSGTVTNR